LTAAERNERLFVSDKKRGNATRFRSVLPGLPILVSSALIAPFVVAASLVALIVALIIISVPLRTLALISALVSLTAFITLLVVAVFVCHGILLGL
jgi:hypothetical protein